MEIQLHNYQTSFVTPDNIDWFVGTAAINMLVEELKVPEWVNRPHLDRMAQKVMADKTAFVVSDNGVNCGAIAGMVIPNLYDPSRTILAELFWYVMPEYRSERVGSILLKALEDRAKEVADEMTLSILPSSKIDLEALTKRGYYKAETAFRKVF